MLAVQLIPLLLQRLGRRALLLISLGTMSFSSVVLAYAINHSHFFLASTMIILFVATFSIGLGPIPFVLMGELPPPRVSVGPYGRRRFFPVPSLTVAER